MEHDLRIVVSLRVKNLKNNWFERPAANKTEMCPLLDKKLLQEKKNVVCGSSHISYSKRWYLDNSFRKLGI